ncbi:MAG: response regulator [Thiotrichaceae bacterium]
MKMVLVVDDEEHIRNSLREFLDKYQIVDVASREEMEEAVKSQQFDYAIIDLKLDNSSEYGGIEVFKLMKQTQPTVHCIILSAYPLEGEVEKQFDELLKSELNSAMILEEARENYISKGGEKNYILAVIDKLNELRERAS